jgi:hypothetical protein
MKVLKSQMLPFGISGGFNVGDLDTKYTIMDINGDGLPDVLMQPGEDALNFFKDVLLISGTKPDWMPPPPLMVSLNLGYEFAAPEPWGEAFIDKGKSYGVNFGGNLGFNKEKYSIAGGVSLTCSVAEAAQALIDVNGDGLLDQVKIEKGQFIN